MRSVHAHELPVLPRLAFSPDGRLVASDGDGGRIVIWEVSTGRKRMTLTKHSLPVCAVAFSPDGNLLASAGMDRKIILWEFPTANVRAVYYVRDRVGSIAFSPDGKTLASAIADKTVDLWDIESPKERTTIRPHIGDIFDIAFSPDGTMLGLAGPDNPVVLWDVANSEVRLTLDTPVVFKDHPDIGWTFKGRPLNNTCLAFSADGRLVACGTALGTVRIWDASNGELVRVLKGQTTVLKGHTTGLKVMSVAFSPDGTTIASGDVYGSLKLWKRVPSGPSVLDRAGLVSQAREQQKRDTITLTNENTLAGEIQNPTFSIETSYGKLTFKAKDVDSISLQGAGNNVDVVRLKVGDRLSGVVQDQKIGITLLLGTSIEIDKEKVKEIQMRQSDVDFRLEPANRVELTLVAPFTREEAVGAQKEWSQSLGTPVEITNSIGIRLALIPPREFLMGSPKSEEERREDEYQHRVRIMKPFYLGIYEVTQAEYERVMKENPSWFSTGGDGKDEVSGFNTSRFPVEYVSWEDAVAFCRRLSAMPEELQAGRVYRLPTEAEWEYACRAGTTTPFHFGSELNGGEANCYGSAPYGTTEKGPYLKRTTTVGSYAPNAFGLFDMHGNIWEWCRDRYDEEYYRSSPVDDPQGPEGSTDRVRRGGSWDFLSAGCRSAQRNWSGPVSRGYDLGFRVAAVPSGK